MYTVIYLVAILAFFYFMMIRPQQKKTKELNNMRANLKVGDEITTIGGIGGKVKKISDDTILLKSGDVTLKISKWAIGSVENSTADKKDDAPAELNEPAKESSDDENKLNEANEE